MKVKNLIEILLEYDPEEEVAYSIFDKKDIVASAKDMGIIPSSAQVKRILKKADEEFDPNVGITWAVIDETIKFYCSE